MSHKSDLISEDILEYLKQHENKELLRLLTCGSVDDGKSTLIGRLLHDSKMIYEDQLAAVSADSKKVGTTGEKIDLALLVDGLQAEREQGITIDVAYRYFSTDKRKFIIADTPGHEQYTRNMATGASTCDLAVILIDARQGVLTQTKRHTYIASLLGIKHIIVAINKMDLVDFSQEVFNNIRDEYNEFSKSLTLHDVRFVPISALDGDNVVNPSEKSPWYDGPTMMEILETVAIDQDKNLSEFRLPVQWVNRPDLNFRGFSGTIASGIVKPGDTVMALPSRKTSTVKSIVTYDGDLEEAFVGQAVTITLHDEIDVSRGDMLVTPDVEPLVAHQVQADVVWMTEAEFESGKSYDFKVGPQLVSGTMTNIEFKTNVNTLEHESGATLALNEIGTCNLAFNKDIAFDPYQQNRNTGAFIIIDRLSNVTVGAGMIRSISDATDQNPVTAEERSKRFNQKPAVISVANEELALQLERRLFDTGHLAIVLQESETEQSIELLKKAGLITIVTAAFDNADFTTEETEVSAILNELHNQNYLS